MSFDVFDFKDDSKDKLSLDVFVVIIAFWGFGMVFGICCLVAETYLAKKDMQKSIFNELTMKQFDKY